MRKNIPPDVKMNLFDSLEDSLGEIDKKRAPGRIAEEFNIQFKKEFERIRRSKRTFGGFFFPPVFNGEYGIWAYNPKKLLKHKTSLGAGCKFVNRNPDESIIARAVFLGKNENIYDTRKDPNHWECDPTALHELVYPIFGAPFSKGPFEGYRLVVAAFDFDFKEVGIFTKRESEILGEIIAPYGPLIYPGEPKFEFDPQGDIYVMSPQEAKKRGLDKDSIAA